MKEKVLLCCYANKIDEILKPESRTGKKLLRERDANTRSLPEDKKKKTRLCRKRPLS